MISSEAVPFAKSGGLGDAVSALAVALSGLGHDVRLLIPRYYSIAKEGLKALEGPMGVPMGDSERWTEVFSALLPNSHVPVYFL